MLRLKPLSLLQKSLTQQESFKILFGAQLCCLPLALFTKKLPFSYANDFQMENSYSFWNEDILIGSMITITKTKHLMKTV